MERLCVLRQCQADIDFLLLQTKKKKNDCDTTSPYYDCLDRRLAAIEAVLQRLSPLFFSEGGDNVDDRRSPFSCRLELSSSGQPYEKVLCELPFVLLDAKGRRATAEPHELRYSFFYIAKCNRRLSIAMANVMAFSLDLLELRADKKVRRREGGGNNGSHFSLPPFF